MYVAKCISVRPFARGCVEIGLRGAVSKSAIRIFRQVMKKNLNEEAIL